MPSSSAHRIQIVLACLLGAFYLTSCTRDDSPTDVPENCPERWTAVADIATRAATTVAGGAFNLSATAVPAASQHQWYAPVTGDSFTIVIHYSGFSSGGSGSYFQAYLAGEGAHYAIAGTGNLSEEFQAAPALSTVVDEDGNYSETQDADVVAREASDVSGILTFAKSGSNLSVTHVTGGGKTSTRTSTVFTGNAFNLSLQIGNNNPTAGISGTVSVNVSAVEGPAGVADDFDCDSRKP